MTSGADGRRPVVVAGVGETEPLAADERSIPEMVLHAVQEALADAGLAFGEIDAVVTASVDLFDGLTASNVAVTEVVGAVMRPETRIAADGLAAVIHGACQLWAGAYDTVLVVAHGKPSMADHDALLAWAMDPVHLQPLGVDGLVCAGLEARRLAAADPSAEERWASIAARRRADAARRGRGEAMSAEDILISPIVASPIRAGMVAPFADAACAVVLRTDEREEGERPRIALRGVGHDLAPHAPGERELGRWDGLRRACRRALALAGIDDPARAFDLLEPSCRFVHEEDLFLAASGARGGAVVSPDGGLFAGATPVAAGLSRCAAAARWLRRARPGSRALVQGTWGPAGQGQAVAVLESEP